MFVYFRDQRELQATLPGQQHPTTEDTRIIMFVSMVNAYGLTAPPTDCFVWIRSTSGSAAAVVSTNGASIGIHRAADA